MLLLAALAAGAAQAAPVLDAPSQDVAEVAPGSAGEAEARVGFHLDEPGRFYAKLLVTPWNAVNSGTPNGSVAADHSRGLMGWWVEFQLADGAGQPLARDASGQEVPASLGAYVDSTPTPLVALDAGKGYVLVARVHVPAEAALPGAEHRVAFALATRAEAPGDASGGTLDPSRGFTAVVRVAGGPAPAPGQPAGGEGAAVPPPGPGGASEGLPGPGAPWSAPLVVIATLLAAALAGVLALGLQVARLRRELAASRAPQAAEPQPGEPRAPPPPGSGPREP